MMSTGSLPLAGLPHHGGQNFENTDTDPCCNHDQHDQNHPGDNRDTLNSAPAGCAGYVSLTGNWLNTGWRS